MKHLKTFFFSVILLFIVNYGYAQEYQVKDLQLTANDPAARENAVKDLNGDACALVKLLASDKVQKVEGNIIGQPQRLRLCPHGS